MDDQLANKSLRWKVKKLLTYVRLFGPRRTLAKVQSQRHLARKAAPEGRFDNPSCSTPDSSLRQVAIIGCGNFAFSTISYYLHRENPQFLRATFDIDHARAVSLCSSYDGAYATQDVQDILDDEAVQVVFICSNHATHATYAQRFIAAGKAVHIEKPHAVDEQQIVDLAEAMRLHPSVPVFLGYNRPRSSHLLAVTTALTEQDGPSMLSWFVAGHMIPEGHWYFSEPEGGRVLGNLCHWLDASMQLVGENQMFPCRLTPSSRPTSKSDFALTIDCADGSLVTISFSAKGETFEGVREILNAHRGNCLVLLRDFEETRIHIASRRSVHRTPFRDHGHGANILHSYRKGISSGDSVGESMSYVLNSGWLSLAARYALESGEVVTLRASPVAEGSPWSGRVGGVA